MLPRLVIISFLLIHIHGSPVQSVALESQNIAVQPSLNLSFAIRKPGSPDLEGGAKKSLSHKGLNEKMYQSFGFNGDFNRTSFDSVDGSFYHIYALALKHLREGAAAKTLTADERKIWDSIRQAARESYYEERGVVVRDKDSSKWMFCGWVNLSNTVLLTGNNYIRLCECIKTLELKEITRAPVPNKDYFERDTMIKLHLETKKMVNTARIPATDRQPRDTDSRLRYPNGSAVMPAVARSEAIYMNIFAVSSERYAEDCISSLATTCLPGLWCYSAYISSPFCLTYPVNCA